MQIEWAEVVFFFIFLGEMIIKWIGMGGLYWYFRCVHFPLGGDGWGRLVDTTLSGCSILVCTGAVG